MLCGCFRAACGHVFTKSLLLPYFLMPYRPKPDTRPSPEAEQRHGSSITSASCRGRGEECVALSSTPLLLRMRLRKRQVSVSWSMWILVLLYFSHFSSVRKCFNTLPLFLSWASDTVLYPINRHDYCAITVLIFQILGTLTNLWLETDGTEFQAQQSNFRAYPNPHCSLYN